MRLPQIVPGALALLVVAAPAFAQGPPAIVPAGSEGAAPAAAKPTMGTVRLEVGVDGALVFIDDEEVGRTPLPGPWTLPAGRHRIVVRPPDGAPASAEVTIEPGGRAEVELLTAPAEPAPTEKRAGPAVVQAPARIVHTGPGFSLATAGYVTAGAGLAALAAGALFTVGASSTADEARALERTDPANRRADLEALADDADRSAFYGNVLLGVGAAALAGGAAMLLLASDGPLAPDAAVTVTPTAVGASFGGRF